MGSLQDRGEVIEGVEDQDGQQVISAAEVAVEGQRLRSRAADRPVRLLLVVAAVCLLGLLGAGIGLVVDQQRITGAPAWLKPAKFAISITVYCLTLSWMLTFVRGRRRLVRAVAWATGVALLAELVLIDLQVLRGTTSHFNGATAFDATLFEVMGGLIAVVFLAGVVAAVLVVRQGDLPPVLGAGIRGGVIVSVLGMAQAGLMLANRSCGAGGHTIGAPDGGPGLPVTGWSTEHGDLRVAHFVGLHALQALPLMAWLLLRYAPFLGDAVATRLMVVASLTYAGLVMLLTWQAERGLPLLRPDGPVVTVALLGLLVTATATALTVRGRIRAMTATPVRQVL